MINKSSQKQKALKLGPLQLMRHFYRDYSKTIHVDTSQPPQKCKYYKQKTNSANKMSKFLFNNNLTTSQYTSLNTQSTTKLNIAETRKHTTIENKRCYFKSTYCGSHPFLTTQHKILPKEDIITTNEKNNKEDRKSIRKHSEPCIKAQQNKQLEINVNILKDYVKFTRGDNIGRSPVQNRQQLRQIKQKMMRSKEIQKQKMVRIRHNYLLNNCYRGRIMTEMEQKGHTQKHMVDSLAKTKQSIFPTSKPDK